MNNNTIFFPKLSSITRKSEFYAIIFLIIYACLLYIPFLGYREFQGEAARRAIIALEMLETNNFIVPHIEHKIYLLKPPLYNWILAVFFKLFNVTEFVARLTSVCFATLTAIIISLIYKTFFEEKTWKFILPGLLFLTFPDVVDKACRAEIELSYVFFISASLFSWIFFFELKDNKLIAWTIGYLFISLATLDKTIQALSYFLFPIAIYLLSQKKFKYFFSLEHFYGIIIFLLFFGSWLILASTQVSIYKIFKAWFSEYLWKKNPSTPGGFWEHLFLFPLGLLKGYFPWIFYLLIWVKLVKIKILNNKQKKFFFFCVCILAIIPLYWLIPGSRLRYILPCAPALAFLCTYPLIYNIELKSFPKIVSFFWSFIFIIFAISFFIVLYLTYTKSQFILSFWPLIISFLILIIVITFFTLKKPSHKIIICFLLVLLAKNLYSSIYFPYKDANLSHYKVAAKKLKEKIPYGSILCDLSDRTPHFCYYLKYRWTYVKDIYLLNTKNNLSKCDYIFSIKPISQNGLKEITLIKARNYQIRLYKVIKSKIKN